MTLGHWQFPKEFDVEEWCGFTYCITNLTTGKRYFGKKSFWSTTRKRVAGRRNRKVTVKESSWRTYTGSSDALNADIEALGKDNFHFQIVGLHESKASLSYAEIKLIIWNDALVQENNFYNRMLPPIKFKVNNPTDKEGKYHIGR